MRGKCSVNGTGILTKPKTTLRMYLLGATSSLYYYDCCMLDIRQCVLLFCSKMTKDQSVLIHVQVYVRLSPMKQLFGVVLKNVRMGV